MSNYRQILIVSFLFPPENTMGAVRIGKFAKYLPEYSWNPFVLTVNKIESLAQMLPIEIDEENIIRTPYYSINDLLFEKYIRAEHQFEDKRKLSRADNIIKDKMINLLRYLYNRPEVSMIINEPWGWYKYAIKQGIDFLAKEKIDAIFSSHGPSISHIVANKLHHETGIPWFAEYRDPWSFNQYNKKIFPFSLVEQKIEKEILKSASEIITISDALAYELEKFHNRKIYVVPNGFDEDDYKQPVETSLIPKFRMTYTGTIYPHKRNPEALFRALSDLRDEGIINQDLFELSFYGNCNFIGSLIEKYNLNDIIKLYGSIPYKKSIEKQKESTVLLLLSWDDPKEWTYSGKLFEYFGACRPILALAYENGPAARLIRDTQCGIVANEQDIIKNIIIEWMDEWKTNNTIKKYYNPQHDIIQLYTRKTITGKLIDIIEKYCQ
jgi:glycosyltransferase involved in cell wall biosynthesis